ncbi:MAG TPA: hypothetical protein HPP51_00760 [Planctomycetes bacterium]|nr:hypothetical protein [Planctomycetota bacterium]
MSEQVKIKEVRNRLMQYLDTLYPSPVQLATLFKSMVYLYDDYELVLFKKDIAYLAAKDYIEYVDEKIGGVGKFLKKVVRLTAVGKEIAEKTQTDPALEI